MKTLTSFSQSVVIFTCLIMITLLVTEVHGQSSNTSDVRWTSYADAAEQADAVNKKRMLFLEAEWCIVCKRMHREVFTNGEVSTLINNDFYAVRMDIESEEMIPVNREMISKKEYSKSIGIYGTPTILFIDSNDDVIGNFVGYLDEKGMVILLNFIKSDAYLTENLESYSRP